MWPFKSEPLRKPVIHHELVRVGFAPIQKSYMRPVECKHCGKQFIMDVFGGWAIEWTFRELEKNESLKIEDLQPAIDQYFAVKSPGWIQLGYKDVCEKARERG